MATGNGTAWPRLPLRGWRETYATLHRWTQVVGKTRLGLAPKENHWWHAALYLTARGLGTSPIPYGTTSFEVEFDFIGHELLVRTSSGGRASLPLVPRTVAEFYRKYMALLRSLAIEPRIRPEPSEMPPSPTLAEDRLHGSYDSTAAHRFWTALRQADRVFKRFRGRFLGKSSPSHFWWGSFDLACTRFSGRQAPPHPGGIPNIADSILREAYSHECVSAGFWPGTVDGPVDDAAFYAYAYPEPPGCPEAPLLPGAARYDSTLHEWILPYDAVASAPDPDSALLDFLQSTYEAGATLSKWDRLALDRPPRDWP